MKRIATAAVLIPAVVWLVLFAPQWAFRTAAALVGLLAYREFDSVIGAGSRWSGAAAGIALFLIPRDWTAEALVVAALFLVAAQLRAADLAKAVPAAGSTLLGLAYIFGALLMGTWLREINPHWLLLALLVSWAGDTAAMYAGKAFGRHKLAPRVSPGKTWEGSIASVVGGVAGALVYARFLIPAASVATVLGIGTAANVAGQLGDLAESAIKRGAGVKDSGSSLPGHGGWLDRIDSSLFAIPITYVAVKLLALY
jgi:phosphatidate cytidylyltransferase